jgi:hypothetical protein
VSVIRTEEGRKRTSESESEPYSDKERQKKDRSSPKVDPIRTEEGRKRTSESESEPYSDKERQEENARVRNRTPFGQRKTEKRIT